MARRIVLRHKEAERKERDEQISKAHDEALREAIRRRGAEEEAASLRWKEDVGVIAGAQEFSDNEPIRESDYQYHTHNFMYSLNNADITDLPNLLRYQPTMVERTVRETANEAHVLLIATFDTHGASTGGEALQEEYGQTLDRNSSRLRQFLFQYEGTVYSAQSLEAEEPEYGDISTLSGGTRRIQLGYGTLRLTANAIPDRHPSKRGIASTY